MGLDIYFYKVSNVDNVNRVNESLNKIYEIQETIEDKYNSDLYKSLDKVADKLTAIKEKHIQVAVGYLRKAYFVLDYFRYKDNCSNMVISRESVEELLSCLNVINEWDIDDYDEETYNNKVCELLGVDADSFWNDDTPYMVKQKDLFTHIIGVLENVLLETDSNDYIILHGWW